MKYEINDNFGAALIRSQFVVLRHIFAISDKDQTLKITKNPLQLVLPRLENCCSYRVHIKHLLSKL